MKKFREDATYIGNLMIYKNGMHLLYKENMWFSYEEELDKFLSSDTIISYVEDYGKVPYEDITDKAISYIPKDIEGYIYVDSSSLIEEVYGKEEIENIEKYLKKSGKRR